MRRTPTTLEIDLTLTFKPGFRGAKTIYMKGINQQGAYTSWVEVGSWDLSANSEALPPTIWVDAPASGTTVQGTVMISGWAIDNVVRVENPITGAALFVDGVNSGPVNYGTSRPDVCTYYGLGTNCPTNVGFSHAWDTTRVSNGTHTVRVEVADGDFVPKSNSVSLTLTVNNPPPPGPPLVVKPALSYVRLYYPDGTPETYEKQQFSLADGTQTTAVNWSLATVPASNQPRGTITAGGLYTGPSTHDYPPTEAGTVIRVTAVHKTNPTRTGTADIVIRGALAVGGFVGTLGIGTPPAMALWCSAREPVNSYTIYPQVGTINQQGWYTPPTHNYTPQLIRIEASAGPNRVYHGYVWLDVY